MSASLLHAPEGDRNPYETVAWSRHPLEPLAGQVFRVGVRAEEDVGPVVAEWTSSGTGGQVNLDWEGDSWTGELGPFSAACRYRFVAPGEKTDWFNVPIGHWEPISFRGLHADRERIHVLGDHGATLALTPDAGHTLTWALAQGADRSDAATSLRLGEWDAHLEADGSVVLASGQQQLQLGAAVLRYEHELRAWRLWWALDPVEHIFGTGERYDALDQRGRKPDIRVYEQYKGQGSRTYFPVPWIVSTSGYGLAVDGAARVQFDLGSTQSDQAAITVPSPDGASGRWYFGSPRQVLQAYTSDLGSRRSLPMWAFGPWMSGNEWDSDQRVREVVDRTLEEGMPATVLVIEA